MSSCSILLINEIFADVNSRKKKNFSGIGVIMYNNLQEIPFSPLVNRLPDNMAMPVKDIDKIVELFLDINKATSPFHDGFHLVSNDGLLTHICCYFSPPIQLSQDVEYGFGGRYRAAYYGSFLTAVDCVGVIGQNYGPTVFSNGMKLQ